MEKVGMEERVKISEKMEEEEDEVENMRGNEIRDSKGLGIGIRKRGIEVLMNSNDPSLSNETGTSNSTDKWTRGLRHFSIRVCQTVQRKKVTSYSEVADILVNEFLYGGGGGGGEGGEESNNNSNTNTNGNGNTNKNTTSSEDKNIRRRVYDVLNVLQGLDILKKEKKQIQWCGFPIEEKEFTENNKEKKKEERLKLQQQIEEKKTILKNLMLKKTMLRNLAQHNENKPSINGQENEKSLHMPFVLLCTPEEAELQCEISNDQRNVLFAVDKPYQLINDQQILKDMGMDQYNMEDERTHTHIKEYLKSLEDSMTRNPQQPRTSTSAVLPSMSKRLRLPYRSKNLQREIDEA